MKATFDRITALTPFLSQPDIFAHREALLRSCRNAVDIAHLLKDGQWRSAEDIEQELPPMKADTARATLAAMKRGQWPGLELRLVVDGPGPPTGQWRVQTQSNHHRASSLSDSASDSVHYSVADSRP